MSFPSNYTCPEVRINFDIPRGGSYAFTSLSVTAVPEKKQLEFKKLFSYTSCPEESVILRESIPLSSKEALRECAEDQKCKEFVNFYIFNKGYIILDMD